jgi:flagellar motor switch protein FliG
MTEVPVTLAQEAIPKDRQQPETQALTGIRKAAILLVLLGDEAACQVYRHLSALEVQRLTQEIAKLSYIFPETAAQILEEFHQSAGTQDYLAQGGQDYAEELLVKAFGEDGARGLLEEALQAQEANVSNLDTLQKSDPAQLVKCVEGEHAQTVALVLAHLGAKAATTLLVLLPQKVRVEAVRRLAVMQQFSTEMVKRISVVLHRKLAALGEQGRRTYGGVNAVAEMLNRVDPKSCDEILRTIEQEDPKLSLAIRDLMFTFEDLSTIPEASIRELLSQVEKKTLATALKGASEDLKNHFYKSMSVRAVEMLKEDLEALGPVRSRQVHQAQQEIVSLARKLEADGKLALKSYGEDAYVV